MKKDAARAKAKEIRSDQPDLKPVTLTGNSFKGLLKPDQRR